LVDHEPKGEVPMSTATAEKTDSIVCTFFLMSPVFLGENSYINNFFFFLKMAK